MMRSVIHHRFGAARLDEREHLFRNSGIAANVGLLGEPASKLGSLDPL